MLRKLILSAAVSAAAIGGFALIPAAADASPVPASRPAHCRYEVMYLQWGRWQCFGTYLNVRAAERAAHQLNHRGLPTRIVTI